MNELIPIDTRAIDGQAVNTVNARDLHAFLENRDQFANWIRDRIKQYGFAEDVDYTIGLENTKTSVGGATTRREFYITVDMAKELAMVERNDRGKEARRYFLECERRAKSVAKNFTPILTQLEAVKIAVAGWEEAEARAITYQAKAETAEAKVEQMAPTIAAFDRIASAEGSLCITDAAKNLQLQPKKLFSWMHENKWLYGRGGASQNIAYQNRIHQGYLEHKITIVMRSDGTEKTVTQVRVTPKGLARLAKEFPVPEEQKKSA